MVALALGIGVAQAAPPRPVNLAPSADLHYELSARQRGLSLKGEATVHWRAGQGQYSAQVVSRVAMLGTLSDDRSEGRVDRFGLAPLHFSEKRMRKGPMTIEFDRDQRIVRLADGEHTQALKGGEQDRVSVTWQLVALARANGARFTPGSSWPLVVAGRRSVDTWQFKVVKREKVQTGLGQIEAVHLRREAVAGGRDQEIDVWLAPSQQWYPVKLRISEGDKESIDQTLTSISKP